MVLIKLGHPNFLQDDARIGLQIHDSDVVVCNPWLVQFVGYINYNTKSNLINKLHTLRMVNSLVPATKDNEKKSLANKTRPITILK